MGRQLDEKMRKNILKALEDVKRDFEVMSDDEVEAKVKKHGSERKLLQAVINKRLARIGIKIVGLSAGFHPSIVLADISTGEIIESTTNAVADIANAAAEATDGFLETLGEWFGAMSEALS